MVNTESGNDIDIDLLDYATEAEMNEHLTELLPHEQWSLGCIPDWALELGDTVFSVLRSDNPLGVIDYMKTEGIPLQEAFNEAEELLVCSVHDKNGLSNYMASQFGIDEAVMLHQIMPLLDFSKVKEKFSEWGLIEGQHYLFRK